MVVGGPGTSSNTRSSGDQRSCRSRSSTVPDREIGLVTTTTPDASPSPSTTVGQAGPSSDAAKKHRLKSRFQVVRKLGQGTYGKVQLAVNKETGQQVAIKTIKKSKIESEQDLVRIRREIQIMSSIQHPHIIHIFEVFENKDKIVLVMQYASGGELYEYVSARKVLSDQDARRLFRQIATAIYYCHKNKVCHRDLKLENILLDEKGNAKIGDFGLSNVFDERHHLTTFCGSPLYASPEIVKGTPYYGPEVDCWSMGVLLYTLVYGAMPFDGSNFKRLVKQISEANYFEPKNRSEASPLIRRLLNVNPKSRASIIDICADPWVNSGFDTTLLTLAEDMANLTPVRLDILLALAPISPKDAPILTEAEEESPVTKSRSKGTSECDFMAAAEAAKQQQQQQQQQQLQQQQQQQVQQQLTSDKLASDSTSEMVSSIEFIPSSIAAALEADQGIEVDSSASAKVNPSGPGATSKRPAVESSTRLAVNSGTKGSSSGDVSISNKRKKAKPQQSSHDEIACRMDSPGDAERLSSSGYASEAATSILEPNSRRESVFSYSEEGSQQLNIPQATTNSTTDNQAKAKAKLDDPLRSSGGPKHALATRVSAKNTSSKSQQQQQQQPSPQQANESTVALTDGTTNAPLASSSSKLTTPQETHLQANKTTQHGPPKPVAEVKPKQRPQLQQTLQSPQQQQQQQQQQSQAQQQQQQLAISTAERAVTSVSSDGNKSMKAGDVGTSVTSGPSTGGKITSGSPTHAQGVKKKKPTGQLEPENKKSDPVASPGTVTSTTSDTHQVQSDVATTATTTTSPAAATATTSTPKAVTSKPSQQQLKQEIEQKKVRANEQQTLLTQAAASASNKDTPVVTGDGTPPQVTTSPSQLHNQGGVSVTKPILEVTATQSHSHSSAAGATALIERDIHPLQSQSGEVFASPESIIIRDSASNVTTSQPSTPGGSLVDEPVSRRSSLKSSQGSLASGQAKHQMLERRSMSVASDSSAKRRVGRLSIPSFIDLQEKAPPMKKPIPSYGSVQETKKKLLERKDSVQSDVASELEHIFPTIPVQEAKSDVERRSSLAEPLPLQKGPHAVRLRENDPDPEPHINRTGRKVVIRRSTEPIMRQGNEQVNECNLTREVLKKQHVAKTTLGSPLTEEEAEALSSPSPERKSKNEKSELHLVIGSKSATSESPSTMATPTIATGDTSPVVTSLSAKPAPITRSYKKVTFTKDGACITETGKVISQEGPDGTVTRIEQKSKVTHYPAGVEPNSSHPRLVEISSFDSASDEQGSVKNQSTFDSSASASSSNTTVPNITSRVSSSSGLKKSESASSSGSTDIFDDIFDTWTSDASMLFGAPRIKSMFPSPLFMRRSASRNRSGRSSVERTTRPRGESLERPTTDSEELFSPRATEMSSTESPFGPLFRGFPHLSPNMRSLIEKHKSMFAHPFASPFDSTFRSPFEQSGGESNDEMFASPIIRTPLAAAFTSNTTSPLRSSPGNRVMNITVSVDPRREGSSSATSSSDATLRPEEEEESEDSVASRRRVEQWLDTSPDTAATERGSTASSSIYATIRPRPVSRYTRTLSSSVYDDEDESVIGSGPSAGGKRPVVQMRLTLNPGGASTGSRIVYSASPHPHEGDVRSISALDHSDDSIVIPESSSLLEQLRTHGYKNLVSQRLSGLRNPPASFPDVYPGPYKKASATSPAGSNCPPISPESLIHHPLSAWIKSGHELRRICKSNQSKGSSSHSQPHSLPCVLPMSQVKEKYFTSHQPSSPVSEANQANYITTTRMHRKRIDQMTDQEVKQLIRITIERRKLSRNNLHEMQHSHSQKSKSNINNNLHNCNCYSQSQNTATKGDTQLICNSNNCCNLNNINNNNFNDMSSTQSKKSHLTLALPGEPINCSNNLLLQQQFTKVPIYEQQLQQQIKPTSEANACFDSSSSSTLNSVTSPKYHSNESWSLNHFNPNPPKSKIEIGQKTNGLTTRTTKSSIVDPTCEFESQTTASASAAIADGKSNSKGLHPNLALKDPLNSNCKSNIESSLDSTGTNNNLNQVKQSTNHWSNSTSTAVNNNNLTARSNSPSLEQLMEYHRTSGVTVRPKIWPRVRKEPLFAPLWETQSARDSPTSDSIMKSPGPTTTISSMANGSSPSPILSSPSPSSCLLADGSVLTPNSVATVATAAATAAVATSTSCVASPSSSITQPSHLHGPGSEMPDRATNCMSLSESTNSNGGTCVTSPTTLSSSPSLELNSPTASGHVLFTCGDANSNSNSTRSSIYIRSEPKLTSDQKISSTHLSDRSRRLNHRRSSTAAATAATDFCINSTLDPTASLEMTHETEKLTLKSSPDDVTNGNALSNSSDNFGQIVNGHFDSISTSNSSASSTRNGPLLSTLDLETNRTPRNSYLDDATSGIVDGKLPPKPPTCATTTANGNEETVRERIHRKSFYQRFNDDSGHNSPRFKSASPARRRSSFLEGDDFVQVNANGSSFMRRCFSHNPSPSPTPGHRPSYNQSVSMIDRKESAGNSDWFSRMEAKANQMLSDMKSQITDVGGVKVDLTSSAANGHCDSDVTRRRSTSLLRNSGKNVPSARPNSSYYAALGDSDTDDEELIPSRGKSYSRKNSFLNGSTSAASGVPDGLLHHQINSTFK